MVSFESLVRRTVAGELHEVLGVRVARSAAEWERLWGVLSHDPPEFRDPVPEVEWGRSMVIVAAAIVADTSYQLDVRSVLLDGTRLVVEARRTRVAEIGLMVLSTGWHAVTIEALEFDHAELVDGDR